MTVVWIQTRQEMYDLRTTLGVRMDWHEPDQQDVDAEVQNGTFDNAHCDESEAFIRITKNDTEYRINLAILCAWAAGLDQ
jgi:hypothetical protein